MSEPVSVQAALSAVMAELPGFGKDQTSPQGYKYRGIESMTKALQPLLARHGVVIAPRSTITDVRPSPGMGDKWHDVYLAVDWLIVGPDGSTIEARTVGIGRDNSDKGANKAQTQAYKYLLMELLCVGDSDDDGDGHRDEPAPPPEPTVEASVADEWVARMNEVADGRTRTALKNRFGKAFGQPHHVHPDKASEVDAFLDEHLALIATPADTNASEAVF